MRLIGLFWSLVFTVFAALQYNDEDWYIWIPAYLIPAFISLHWFRGRLFPRLYALAFVLYMAFSIYLWPESFEGISRGMDDHPHITQARESLGLLMVALVIGFYGLAHRLNWYKPR